MGHHASLLLANTLALTAFVLAQALAGGDADAICAKLVQAPGDVALLKQLKSEVGKATDAGTKARLAVIYCLGCLYTGQSKEAATVEAYLKRDFPKDPHMQFLSSGRLRVACQECAGAGKVAAKCDRCRGSGNCTVCKGRGQRTIQTVSGSRTTRCSACGGSRKCASCDGSADTQSLCPACRGAGGITSRERVKAAYLASLASEDGDQSVDTSLSATRPAAEPLPRVDTTGMNSVLGKRLASYRRHLEEKKDRGGVDYLDSLIFDIEGDLDERDTGRQGWSRYQKQSQELLAYAKREKKRQKEAAARAARAEREAAAPYEEQREKLIAGMTPSQKAVFHQSLTPRNATPKERLEHVERIIREDEERQKNDQAFEEKLSNAKAERADFDKVLFEPEKYNGKVLASTVQLSAVMPPRFVVVRGSPLSQDQMVPCSASLCDKAIRVLKIKGQHAIVSIRYTVQNDDPRLLDISLPD